MELRRQVLIKKLEQIGIFEARDGRALSFLTPDELEVELAFAQYSKEAVQ